MSSTKKILHGPSSDLHISLRQGDLSRVKSMLDNGEKLCTGNGQNCFILAASMQRVDLVSQCDLVMRMLEVESDGVSARSEDGSTILMSFASCEPMIQILVEMGADVDAFNNSGQTVLLKSFNSETVSYEAFSFLLKCGALPTLPVAQDGPLKFLNIMITRFINMPDSALRMSVGQMIEAALAAQPVEYFVPDTSNQRSCHPWEMLCSQIDLKSPYFVNLFTTFVLKFQPTQSHHPVFMTSLVKSQCEHKCGVRFLQWQQVKDIASLKSECALEPIGLFLFCVNFKDMDNEEDLKKVFSLMKMMFENGYNYPYEKSVMHPLKVLFLSNIRNWISQTPAPIPTNRRAYPMAHLMFDFFYDCVVLFRESRIPRDTLLTINTNSEQLRQQLINNLPPNLRFTAANVDTMEKIMLELINLKPLHPVIQIAQFFHPDPAGGQNFTLKNPVLKKIMLRCAKRSCNGGLANLGGLIELDFMNLLIAKARESTEDAHFRYMVDFCRKGARSICTLKDLSRWSLRRTIHEKKCNANISLPGYVRMLFDNGRMPETLRRYVLNI